MALAVAGLQRRQRDFVDLDLMQWIRDRLFQEDSANFGLVESIPTAAQTASADLDTSVQLRQVEDDFVFLDRNPLLAYLMNQLKMVPYLTKLVQQTRGIYGEDTLLSLRLDRDPDVDYDYLVVGVRTTLESATAHKLLYLLREDWWSSTPSDVESQVLIANEYM